MVRRFRNIPRWERITGGSVVVGIETLLVVFGQLGTALGGGILVVGGGRRVARHSAFQEQESAQNRRACDLS
jgi:hypothetical protein